MEIWEVSRHPNESNGKRRSKEMRKKYRFSQTISSSNRVKANGKYKKKKEIPRGRRT